MEGLLAHGDSDLCTIYSKYEYFVDSQVRKCPGCTDQSKHPVSIEEPGFPADLQVIQLDTCGREKTGFMMVTVIVV